MILDVWLSLPDASTHKVGELAFVEQQAIGTYASAFRYSPDWLRSGKGFALDPESLPLSGEEFRGHQLLPPLGVFEDALPDAWGRQVLIAEQRFPRDQQSEPYLLKALGVGGLGALAFMPAGLAPQGDEAIAAEAELPELLDAMQRIDAMEPVEGRMRRLLRAGSSAGGARPKAAVRAADGSRWIAKFASRRDRHDIVGLECAAMRCAHELGLDTPQVRLETVSTSKVLLVKRFDIAPDGGRHHMLSLKTLCRSVGNDMLGYQDVAKALLRHAADPRQALTQLWRQMTFNACIGNTDDHLKNFACLHDDHGWRLSPAYDLLPDVESNRYHVLRFGYQDYPPDLDWFEATAKAWRVEAEAWLSALAVSLAPTFARHAVECGVPADQVARFGADIQARVQRVTTCVTTRVTNPITT